MNIVMRSGFEEIEIRRWRDGRMTSVHTAFHDEISALSFLRSFLDDSSKLAELRNLLKEELSHADISRMTDHEVLDELAHHIASGDLRIVRLPPKPCALDLKLRTPQETSDPVSRPTESRSWRRLESFDHIGNQPIPGAVRQSLTSSTAERLRSITVFVHGVRNGPRNVYCKRMIRFFWNNGLTGESVWPTWPPDSAPDTKDRSLVTLTHRKGENRPIDYFIRFNWGDFENDSEMSGCRNPFSAATCRVGRREQAWDYSFTEALHRKLAVGTLGLQMTNQQWAGVDRLKKTLEYIHQALGDQRDKVCLNLVTHSQGTIISLAALQELAGITVDNWFLMGSPLAQEALHQVPASPTSPQKALNETYLRALDLSQRVILEKTIRQMEADREAWRRDDDSSWSKAVQNVRRRVVNFWSTHDDTCSLAPGTNIGHAGLPQGCKQGSHVFDVEAKGKFGRGVDHYMIDVPLVHTAITWDSGWWDAGWIAWKAEYRSHFQALFPPMNDSAPGARLGEDLRSCLEHVAQMAIFKEQKAILMDGLYKIPEPGEPVYV